MYVKLLPFNFLKAKNMVSTHTTQYMNQKTTIPVLGRPILVFFFPAL